MAGGVVAGVVDPPVAPLHDPALQLPLPAAAGSVAPVEVPLQLVAPPVVPVPVPELLAAGASDELPPQPTTANPSAPAAMPMIVFLSVESMFLVLRSLFVLIRTAMRAMRAPRCSINWARRYLTRVSKASAKRILLYPQSARLLPFRCEKLTGGRCEPGRIHDGHRTGAFAAEIDCRFARVGIAALPWAT